MSQLCVDELLQPVIIRGGMSTWRAQERWASKEALAEHYGDLKVRVMTGKCYSARNWDKKEGKFSRRKSLAWYLRLDDAALSAQRSSKVHGVATAGLEAWRGTRGGWPDGGDRNERRAKGQNDHKSAI